MSELRAEHLRKSYRGRAVVADVSLAVRSGEVVGLMGPNGAGKTTCFYMIVGLISVDGGRVLLGDEDLTRLPMHARARRGIGYLPQEPSVFRKLSVEDNIKAVLEIRGGLNRAERQARAEALMEELAISHIRRERGRSLSGGERRRVEIARALAMEPRFMLLDEPFAGVDPIAVKDIRAIVEHLTDRNIGVLITDHRVRETLSICDSACILAEGRILAAGTPDAILADEVVREVYLGDEFSL